VAGLYGVKKGDLKVPESNKRISLDAEITDGKIAKIVSFLVEFDKIEVVFENMVTGLQKRLLFTRVLRHICTADFYDDLASEWDADMENMAYRTLIGLDYTIDNHIYTYCMKIDDYEITIKSLCGVGLINI